MSVFRSAAIRRMNEQIEDGKTCEMITSSRPALMRLVEVWYLEKDVVLGSQVREHTWKHLPQPLPLAIEPMKVHLRRKPLPQSTTSLNGASGFQGSNTPYPPTFMSSYQLTESSSTEPTAGSGNTSSSQPSKSSTDRELDCYGVCTISAPPPTHL
jgi:hypothetical protein